jgi:prophage antirepressor-like protein
MPKHKRSPEMNLWGEPLEEHQQKTDNRVILCDFWGETIRVVTPKGDPWCIASDICRIIEVGNVSDAVARLDDDEKGIVSIDTLGGSQQMLAVNEFGVYALILGCRTRTEKVREFKRWITHDVLPAIRKTGTYQSKSSRIIRVIRRTKTHDATVLFPRVEQLEFNKQINRRLADEGKGPRPISDYHNGAYFNQFGRKARDLREVLKIKDYQTPLDRMAGFPLSQNLHIKMMAEKVIQERTREKGSPLTIDEQVAIISEIARDIIEADFARLGFDYQYGLTEDERRGYVLDVIRMQISSAS